MRVLENTKNKQDYHLSFITTDISFIRGYYTWKLQYHRKKNQIIITIAKQGCVNGNWIASSIISKSFLQTHNISAIDSELHALQNYITHGKKRKYRTKNIINHVHITNFSIFLFFLLRFPLLFPLFSENSKNVEYFVFQEQWLYQ
jgi:hypothetical protein